MLVISEAQYKALSDDARGRSYERIGAYLRANTPPAAKMDERQLNEFIARQETNAAPYDLKSEREIAKWSWLALTVGEDFHKDSNVQAALRRPDIPSPGTRLDLLCKWIADRMVIEGQKQ